MKVNLIAPNPHGHPKRLTVDIDQKLGFGNKSNREKNYITFHVKRMSYRVSENNSQDVIDALVGQLGYNPKTQSFSGNKENNPAKQVAATTTTTTTTTESPTTQQTPEDLAKEIAAGASADTTVTETENVEIAINLTKDMKAVDAKDYLSTLDDTDDITTAIEGETRISVGNFAKNLQAELSE